MQPRASSRVILYDSGAIRRLRETRDFQRAWNREGIDHFLPLRRVLSHSHARKSIRGVGSSLIAIITPLSDAALGVRGRNYFPAKYGRDGNGSACTAGRTEGREGWELPAGLIPRLVLARSPLSRPTLLFLYFLFFPRSIGSRTFPLSRVHGTASNKGRKRERERESRARFPVDSRDGVPKLRRAS